MTDLGRLLSIVCALLSALAAFGWLLDASLSRAVGFLALGFMVYVASLFAPPVR